MIHTSFLIAKNDKNEVLAIRKGHDWTLPGGEMLVHSDKTFLQALLDVVMIQTDILFDWPVYLDTFVDKDIYYYPHIIEDIVYEPDTENILQTSIFKDTDLIKWRPLSELTSVLGADFINKINSSIDNYNRRIKGIV